MADVNLASDLNDQLKDAVVNNQDLLKGTRLYAKLQDQILANERAISEYIEGDVELTQSLVDKNKELLKLIQDKADQVDDIESRQKDIQDSYESQFDGVKKIKNTMAAIVSDPMTGMMLLATVITTQLVKSAKTAFEFYKTQGLSAGESAKTASAIQAARVSSEGLLSNYEDFEKAATGIVEQFGSLSNVTADTLGNVTNLQRYLGDTSGAIKLNALLSSGGKDASAMTDQIERLSREAGVGAAGVMQDLANNAAKLYGASEQETLELIKQSALLRQNGVSLEKAKSIADGMLDIESSLKAEMKARIALGKDVNLSQARNLAMQGKYGEMMQEINKQFGDVSDFASRSIPEQRMIAQAVGMSTDEFAEYAAMNEKVGDLTGDFSDATAEATDKQNNYTQALSTYGPVLASLIPTIGMMIMQQRMMNKLSATGSKSGGMMSSMMGGAGGGGMTSLLKGAAALLIIAASVYVLGKAFQQFADVSWGDIGMAVAALVIFTAAMFGLGALISGPGAVIFGAGVIGFIALGAALTVLGVGIMSIAKGVGMLSELTNILNPMTQLASGLMSLAPSFAVFGLSLIPLAMGLAAITPFLPALLALGAVSGIIIGSGDGEGETSGAVGAADGALIDEIKGLRADLQSQPIQVVFDGKVVSEITRKQGQQSSLRRATK